MRIQTIFTALALVSIPMLLTGCSTSFSPVLTGAATTPNIVQGVAFHGSAMGGNQPITSARVYLYAADTGGYGNASDSLLKADPTAQYPSQLDSNGLYYVTSNPSSGFFYFGAGQYQCAQGQQVYLYLVGGDTGSGQNPAISEMASLGTCNAVGAASPFSQLTGDFVYMNEVSTVAAAYALAGFAVDATHVASGVSALSQVALIRAFQNTANLYNINGGAAQGSLTKTPQGRGTVPYAEVNTLADILASCINSTGSSSSSCSTLFTNAPTALGTSVLGVTITPDTDPTETASAMINIAHNPGRNAATLAGLASNTSPFQPVLATVPNDFSVILAFDNGNGTQPNSIAIDANQDVWITNSGTKNVTELSSVGKVLSGSGFADSNMRSPNSVALDANGDAYVLDALAPYIFYIPNGGSGVTAISAPALTNASSVAIDGNGNIWAAQTSNTALQFTPLGVQKFSATGGGLVAVELPGCIAIDPSNNAYLLNYTESTVAEFNNAGTPVSSSSGYGYTASTQYYGEGIAIDASNRFWNTNHLNGTVTIGTTSASTLASGSAAAGVVSPAGISFDGAGNAWVVDTGGAVSVLNNSGAAVTGSNGYSGATATSMSGITAIATDSAGNVWLANPSNDNIYEFLGAAVPVVTPIVAGLTTPYTPASMP